MVDILTYGHHVEIFIFPVGSELVKLISILATSTTLIILDTMPSCTMRLTLTAAPPLPVEENSELEFHIG